MKKQLERQKIKQSQPEQRLPSTEMSREHSVLLQDPSGSPSLCKLRRTCGEVTINMFRKAYCQNDLNVLIISGEPLAGELQDAWNEIVFEFGGLVHTEDTSRIFELRKGIATLGHHIKVVDHATRLLIARPSKIIADQLLEFGYSGDFLNEDDEIRISQVKRVISLCKTKVFDLEVLNEEYIRLQKANDGKKQTDEDILKNIVMLKRWGYAIDMNVTMLDEYAQAINLYIKETKHSSPNK